MPQINFGLLEYSYTFGFNDAAIINFYIDQRLRVNAKLKKGDRIFVLYNFVDDEGFITKAVSDGTVEKIHIPKLTLSNSSNENGKLKIWHDMNGKHRSFVLLPFDFFQEQIALRIKEVKDGFISFSSGKSTSVEQMIIKLYNNRISSGKLSNEEIKEVQKEIRSIRAENGI